MEPGSGRFLDDLQVDLRFCDDGLSCHLSGCSKGEFPGSGDLSDLHLAGNFIFVARNGCRFKGTAALDRVSKQADCHGAGEVGGAFQLQPHGQGLPGVTGDRLIRGLELDHRRQCSEHVSFFGDCQEGLLLSMLIGEGRKALAIELGL